MSSALIFIKSYSKFLNCKLQTGFVAFKKVHLDLARKLTVIHAYKCSRHSINETYLELVKKAAYMYCMYQYEKCRHFFGIGPKAWLDQFLFYYVKKIKTKKVHVCRKKKKQVQYDAIKSNTQRKS